MKHLLYILSICIFFLPKVEGQNYKVEKVEFSTIEHYERALVPYGNGVVFVSNESHSSYKKWEDPEGNPFNNIYFAELKEDSVSGKVKFGKSRLFSESLTSNFNIGPLCFFENEQRVCFSRSYLEKLGEVGKRSNGNSGLYFAQRENDAWVNEEPFEHNNFDCSYFSPCISKDGKTLYFSSDLDGEMRGFDIYRSTKQEDGSWSVPVNMGNVINTPEDDIYPYLLSDDMLYFSSMGHDTRGGFDIFSSIKRNDEWQEPVKLLQPINSADDDYSFFMTDDFASGYFARRRGSRSTNIYSFESDFPVFQLPRPIKRNRFCYRLKENSLDTIDHDVFYYEWIINDTLKVPGVSVRYCFPGPGDYDISFDVYNKVTDTLMHDVAKIFLPLRFVEQAVITVLDDTVQVNQKVEFSASETYLPRYEIDEYFWDFNDKGAKAKGLEASHTYTSPGTYKVVLGLIEKIDRKADWEPERFAVFKEIVVLPEN